VILVRSRHDRLAGLDFASSETLLEIRYTTLQVQFTRCEDNVTLTLDVELF
jgi:hypothetical protein